MIRMDRDTSVWLIDSLDLHMQDMATYNISLNKFIL